ncbi:MAG TPA: hypothetical protein VHV47_08840, partial [Opitutaceae bacterium]|nr:hypothetical protein [Opitutaceae bacterium]
GPDCLFTVRSRAGSETRVLVLTQKQAGQIWKARLWGADRLFLSADTMIFDRKGVLWTQSRQPRMSFGVYPAPKLSLPSASEGLFTRFGISVPEHKVQVTWEKVRDPAQAAPVRVDNQGAAFAPADSTITAESGVWRVRVDPAALVGVHEVFLDIDYAGDIGRAYLGDRFVDDDYYFGRTWEIGLSRFAPEVLEKGLKITVLPLRKDAPIYLPPGRWPDFGGHSEIGAIRGITAAVLYEARVPEPLAP